MCRLAAGQDGCQGRKNTRVTSVLSSTWTLTGGRGGVVWGGGGGGRRERPADSSGRVEGEVSAVRKKADHFRCLAEVTGGQLCQTLRVLLTT